MARAGGDGAGDTPASRWEVERTERFDRDLAYYRKKKAAALAVVLRNFRRMLDHLELGGDWSPRAFGFLHVEPGGVCAVDESGAGRQTPTRLYVYVGVRARRLHLLAIGGKARQASDIQDCLDMVARIKKQPRAEEESDESS